MRILLSTDHYPPFIGGGHRQSQLLASGLADRGHEVHVITPYHGGLPETQVGEGATIHRVRQIRTALPALVRDRRQQHQPPFPDPVTAWKLRRLITEIQPDIINTHGWLSFSLAAALVGKRIPLLVTARDYGYFCATRTLVRKGTPCSGPGPLKCTVCASDNYGPAKGAISAVSVGFGRRLLTRKMDGLHCISAYVAEAHRDHLLGTRGTRAPLIEAVIPDFQSVDPSANCAGIERVAPDLRALPKEPYILFVGAFRKVKGLETLFAAYQRLGSPPPLVLIGTRESDTPEIPPGAIVLEDLPHAAVLAAWDRAMFGVMPSLLPEPLGGVVIEAMSRGRAVIGSSLGGHRDMLDETNGILVPQGDTAALAEAMQGLIDDPARRDSLGRAATERARQFAAPVVVPRMEQLYRDVIEAAGEPR